MTALVLLLTGASLAPGLQRPVPTPLLPGRWSAAACSSRAPVVRCQEEIPASALENIPPAAMADAWMRDEKARELGEALKGCSVYLVGLGSPKLEAVGRIFSRRLPKYRYYSVPELMCSTYATLSGGEEGAAAPMMSDLYEAEPMDDVTSLARAITDQVQQYTRAVVRSWEGSVSTSDFAVMQQAAARPARGPPHRCLPPPSLPRPSPPFLGPHLTTSLPASRLPPPAGRASWCEWSAWSPSRRRVRWRRLGRVGRRSTPRPT